MWILSCFPPLKPWRDAKVWNLLFLCVYLRSHSFVCQGEINRSAALKGPFTGWSQVLCSGTEVAPDWQRESGQLMRPGGAPRLTLSSWFYSIYFYWRLQDYSSQMRQKQKQDFFIYFFSPVLHHKLQIDAATPSRGMVLLSLVFFLPLPLTPPPTCLLLCHPPLWLTREPLYVPLLHQA